MQSEANASKENSPLLKDDSQVDADYPLDEDIALLEAEGFGVMKDSFNDVLTVVHACMRKTALYKVRAIGSHAPNGDGLIAMPGAWHDAWIAATKHVDACIEELDGLLGEIAHAFAECMRVVREGRNGENLPA
jgi:hypothetical protein